MKENLIYAYFTGSCFLFVELTAQMMETFCMIMNRLKSDTLSHIIHDSFGVIA